VHASLLTATVLAQYACLFCHFGAAAGILLACKDKSPSSSSLKIEALTFLRAAMESNAPAVFQPHVAQLSSGVFAAVGERYYKVGSSFAALPCSWCSSCMPQHTKLSLPSQRWPLYFREPTCVV
jgi:hypothetical protein